MTGTVTPETLAWRRASPDGLSDAELESWFLRCTRQAAIGGALSIRRVRWSRARNQAYRALVRRLLKHGSDESRRCDRCGLRAPTVHRAHRDGVAPSRFVHLCRVCSLEEPPGWLEVVAG